MGKNRQKYRGNPTSSPLQQQQQQQQIQQQAPKGSGGNVENGTTTTPSSSRSNIEPSNSPPDPPAPPSSPTNDNTETVPSSNTSSDNADSGNGKTTNSDTNTSSNNTSSNNNNNNTSTDTSNSNNTDASNNTTDTSTDTDTSTSSTNNKSNSGGIVDWYMSERATSILWITCCALLGWVLGLGIGTGHFTGDYAPAGSELVSPWRIALGQKIRSSPTFQLLTLQRFPWDGIPLPPAAKEEQIPHANLLLDGVDKRAELPTGPSLPDSSMLHRNSETNPAKPPPSSTTVQTNTSWWEEEDVMSLPIHLFLIRAMLHGLGIVWNFILYDSIPPPTNNHNNNFPSSQQQQQHHQNQHHHQRITSLQDNPEHPLVFEALREMIVREHGGYVHRDLGLLSPAPCGAHRGLGMVRNGYDACQRRCYSTTPNIHTSSQHQDQDQDQDQDDGTLARTANVNNNHTIDDTSSQHKEQINHDLPLHEALQQQWNKPRIYPQEQILIRIPLQVQMTRSIALQTLKPRIPPDVQRRAPLEELDDAALLVLLLVHESGRGRESPFLPYVATLPKEPNCGYWRSSRPSALATVVSMGGGRYDGGLGLDVNGWMAELIKASDYADRISDGLATDYGNHILLPRGITAFQAIQWALCQVASRATAANPKHGALRLVPLMDMINHDVDAGGFVELNGNEQIEKGDILDATEDDSGTFTVRSMRHGKQNPLKVGQELMVNYNVPNYSPLDWFVSLGFVPPERSGRWIRIDGALPRIRKRDYGTSQSPSSPSSNEEQSSPDL